MAITVNNIPGGAAPVNINSTPDAADLQRLAAAIDGELSAGDLAALLKGVTLTDGSNLSLDELLKKSVDGAPKSDSPEDLQAYIDKAQGIKEDIEGLQKSKSRLDAFITDKTDATGKVKVATDEAAVATAIKDRDIVKQLISALNGELEEAKLALSHSEKAQANYKEQMKSLFGGDLSGAKGQGAGAGGDVPISNAPDLTKLADSSSLNPFAGAKAQGSGTAPGYGFKASGNGALGPDVSAFGMSMALDDAKLQSFDTINDAQKKQQQMQLFFYYAKMAMSGDMNAMYQFVRFIGNIIATDKALQNVWMGTKLIELQDVSRKATQKLMDAQVSSGDQDSQYSFEKTMEEVKGEENTVATSQKLISQMMEEFTQVVELTTNLQKSLLDANGKQVSNISVWR